MNLPTLTGTPKQVAYATAIRAKWVAGQQAQVEIEREIAAGNGRHHLVMGPHEEMTESAFAGIAVSRADHLIGLVATRMSAKAWIESTEGQWFRLSK